MSRLAAIVAAWGGVLLDGGRRALIPGPGHSQADRSVSLLETEDGRILIHCFSPRDDWRTVRDCLAAEGLIDAGQLLDRAPTPPAPQPRQKTSSEEPIARAHRIWSESKPIAGTIAESYLIKRAIDPSRHDLSALRFHPSTTSLEDRKRYPALIAAIADQQGALQGVQITLLSRHGAAKAALETPRRVLGRMLGGAVRLGAPGKTLIIAEGVETALSAAEALGVPAWAALSAHNMSLFEPPSQLTELIIAHDNDAAGRAAAERLLSQQAHGVRTVLRPPSRSAGDWNDYARRAAG